MKFSFVRSSLIAATAAVFMLSTAAIAAVDEDAAKSLAKKNDCLKCHAIDKTKKGPSYKKIAAKYKGKEAEGEQKMIKNITTGPNSSAFNVDASYNVSENSMFGAYASWMNQRRDMNVAQTVSATTGVGTNIWANRLNDRENAIGLYAKAGGLMGGKLSLKGDLSWSDGRMNYATGSYPANAATCATTGTLTCGQTPNVISTLLTVKLEGNYQLDKASKIRLGYLFQQLNSNDYAYNIYQMGYTPNATMPSNQQAANYSVNVVMASYIYSFQ